MPSEPQDCPDCDGPCEMIDLPTRLRPYCCRHVTDNMRRLRDKAWARATDTSNPAIITDDVIPDYTQGGS